MLVSEGFEKEPDVRHKLACVQTAARLMGIKVFFGISHVLSVTGDREYVIHGPIGPRFYAHPKWYHVSSYEHILKRVLEEVKRSDKR